MHFTAATLALAAFATSVSAHATMFGVSVNGVDQGDGRNVYIRSPPNNSPVKNLASPDLICGPNGGRAVGTFVKAAAGSKLTFEWYHDNRNDDIIDGSHKGPIITYIAPFTEGNGVGPIWSKIAEDGFSNGQWAVDKIRANNGKIDFTLPANIAAGKYLIRQEIIALHEGDTAFSQNAARGAQFYPSCVQFEVSGSGSVVPNQNFDINKGYTSQDPGIVFNIYQAVTSYPIPGPKIFSGSGASPAPAPVTTSAPASVRPTTTAAPVVPTTSSAVVVAPVPTPSSAAPVVVQPTTTAVVPPVPTTLATLVRPSAKPTRRPCPAFGKAKKREN
ncbi:glycosyl hydrolase family 61-domain-containing protein [Podospora australis]|uniref:lytic cellulose monooxygenase (C4-dehydrogenating) n=1 Tax=Podospora australis TaxID=1536484 RepID=A0AAN6WJ48_9PEZI|nr:glycosyl hydrolase family 61-domain-containing protein [Podospora australis]